MERVKYAAVGCGGMGRRHLNGAAALAQSSQHNFELVAVCDLNQDNANYLADEAEKLLGTRPKLFADIEKMAREIPDLRAVDVTTDSGSHHTVASSRRRWASPLVIRCGMVVTMLSLTFIYCSDYRSMCGLDDGLLYIKQLVE